MDRLRKIIKEKPHIAIGVPTILCAITFITNLVAALKDGVIDNTELHGLLSTAEGFETVALFVVMLALKK